MIIKTIKTRTIWLLLVGVVIPVSALGANLPRQDSLLQAWKTTSFPDSSRMKAMVSLISRYYSSKNPDSAQYFSQQLYDFAIKANDQYFQAQSQNLLGTAFIDLGLIDKAKISNEKALILWEELENKKGLANTYNSLGIINKRLGEYEKALEFLEQGMAIQFQLKDSARTSSYLLNIASIYEALGNVLKSLDYNQKGLEICQKYGNTLHEAIAHNNLANNYKYLGDISNATKHYIQSRSIYESTENYWGAVSSLNNLALLHIDNKDYAKAKTYLDEALKLSSDFTLYQGQAMTYSNIATWYQAQEQFPEALDHFKKSLGVIKKHGIGYMEAYTELEIGNILLSLKKLEEAENYLTKGLANSRIQGITEDVLTGYLYMSQLLVEQKKWAEAQSYALDGFKLAKDVQQSSLVMQFAQQLVPIYKHFGDTSEALRMYEVEIALRDSIYNEENTRTLINQEYQYDYEKKTYQDSLKNVAKLELQASDIQQKKLTNWFLLGILLLAAIFGGILFNRYRLIQEQEKRIKEEKNRAEAANAKLLELDQYKSQFFTNISHEFRTPLTVIGGMISQLKTNPEKWLAKGSHLIERNVANLLSLINQILDLRKLESGNLSLTPIQNDIIPFLKYGTESFESLAASQSISLLFETNLDEQAMDFDPDKLLQIQTNLISNAIKFTQEKGQVKVKVKKETEDKLTLIVSDTGRGIPADKISKIFDRFYQVDSTDTREGEGTGIGLALTKELVRLMEGEIHVESEVGKGTMISITLPITQIAPIRQASTPPPEPLAYFSSQEPLIISQSSNPIQEERPSLLIIEDNPDIVEYLFTCLEDQYELFTAPNGEEGIETAFEQVPDLIITDVMMPKKNGYEVCEILKLDERTSHIPIVMLTARVDQPSKIEGFKRGADAYLAKPFDQEELQIRLEKLFEIRKTLRLRYQSSEAPPPTHDAVVQIEDAFISKVRQLVIDHIDDGTYRGDSICKELGIGRTNLYRKIKALTGQSISYFIRRVRIEYAGKLLQNSELQVAEVTYMVGYNDPAYFNRVFQEVYGVPPGEWRTKNVK